ncbi:hypothetical protein J7K50_01575 [bacterium]|nr:hypothetical protein [bacterium]
MLAIKKAVLFIGLAVILAATAFVIAPKPADWSKGASIYKTLFGHTIDVNSASFSPDGRFIVTGSWDNTARIWSVPDGGLINTLTGHSSWVECIAFSSDGRHLATASDKTARIWSVHDGALITTLRGHSGNVWSIAYSPDGKYLATGSADGACIIWDPTA